MMGPRNLHPDELGDTEGMDLHDAMRVANRLTESMDDVPVHARLDFTDHVMAALADEPTPGTTGFLLPLRRRGVLGGFRDSFRQAWASVGSGRPMLGRSAALAYVLAVAIAGVSLTGVATLGAAGALGLLNPAPSTSPTPPPPAPTPVVPPTIAPSPSPNANEPTEEPSPSETADESEGPDDNGGSSGPGGGDDSSGPGGGDDSSGPGGGDDSSGPGGGDDSSESGTDDSGRGSREG
jgi:uncharacterized membrane protein YgcG